MTMMFYAGKLNTPCMFAHFLPIDSSRRQLLFVYKNNQKNKTVEVEDVVLYLLLYILSNLNGDICVLMICL